jgi:hypothetical protein
MVSSDLLAKRQGTPKHVSRDRDGAMVQRDFKNEALYRESRGEYGPSRQLRRRGVVPIGLWL